MEESLTSWKKKHVECRLGTQQLSIKLVAPVSCHGSVAHHHSGCTGFAANSLSWNFCAFGVSWSLFGRSITYDSLDSTWIYTSWLHDPGTSCSHANYDYAFTDLHSGEFPPNNNCTSNDSIHI